MKYFISFLLLLTLFACKKDGSPTAVVDPVIIPDTSFVFIPDSASWGVISAVNCYPRFGFGLVKDSSRNGGVIGENIRSLVTSKTFLNISNVDTLMVSYYATRSHGAITCYLQTKSSGAPLIALHTSSVNEVVNFVVPRSYYQGDSLARFCIDFTATIPAYTWYFLKASNITIFAD